MSRKSILTSEYKKTLSMVREGSIAKRSWYRNLMRQIINDLYCTHHIPRSWRNLTSDHINELVAYWRRKPYAYSTIKNRLAALRYFIKHSRIELIIPSNKMLDIKAPKNEYHKYANLQLNAKQTFNKISANIVKCIFGFQVFFGLTKKEAMLFVHDTHHQNNQVHISKEISYNKTPRTIPILNQEQLETLKLHKALVSSDKCLLSRHRYHALAVMFHGELKQINLPSSNQYRAAYTNYRFNSLKKTMTKENIFLVLKQELGLKTNLQISRHLL